MAARGVEERLVTCIAIEFRVGAGALPASMEQPGEEADLAVRFRHVSAVMRRHAIRERQCIVAHAHLVQELPDLGIRLLRIRGISRSPPGESTQLLRNLGHMGARHQQHGEHRSHDEHDDCERLGEPPCQR